MMLRMAAIDGSRAWLRGSTSLVLVAVAAATLVWRAGEQDVRLCRRVLTGLAQGRPSVRHTIAWERLRVFGTPLGEGYRALPNDQERADYQRAFIAKFPEGFRRAGGRVRDFTHWRTLEQGTGPGIVAAEHRPTGRTLRFTLSDAAPPTVESVAWQE